MHPSVFRFARALAAVAFASTLVPRPALAQETRAGSVLVLAEDAEPTEAPPEAEALVPPRRRGRLEVAMGSAPALGSAFLGVIGGFMHGPPIFCGIDFWGSGDSSDSCEPQGEGGPWFVAAAIAGVTGIVLVTVGGVTIHRRNAALRALRASDPGLALELRPVVRASGRDAGGALALSLRF